MRTRAIIQQFFRNAFPDIHAARRHGVAIAVATVAQGTQLGITALGRSMAGPTRLKHRVKQMDRLIGNRRLHAQRLRLYQGMTHRLLRRCKQPIILIDWSDFSNDRQKQLLRASLPVGGRALTLYEERHPLKKLGNRRVQHRFLDQLHAMLPAHCRPIVIADAGFRVPFYRYVERLGWHWVGRIRNRDPISRAGTDKWFPAKD
jgi:hypothetical protein